MSSYDQARGRRVNFERNENDDVTDDSPSKRKRLFVISTPILKNTVSTTRQMPLDLDNGLPGILVRFGNTDSNELSFICLVDTCAAMNTGNLLVHQWIMTQYPELVAEYIQYDDENPFQPLKLECAVKDLAKADDLSSKLTAIVRYWTRYKEPNGKRAMLSFGLGKDIAVNSIIGIPTIRRWGMNLCFLSSTITAHHLKVRFSTAYEQSKSGLPASIEFTKDEFVRPAQGIPLTATALVTNLDAAITDGCHDGEALDTTTSTSEITTDDNTNGFLRRVVETPHLE